MAAPSQILTSLLRAILFIPRISVRLNGEFVVWWQSKLQSWSELRGNGPAHWLVWEFTWPLLLVCTAVFYVYTIPWVVAGYVYDIAITPMTRVIENRIKKTA